MLFFYLFVYLEWREPTHTTSGIWRSVCNLPKSIPSCILHPPASWEWNSGFQIWWQAPFSTESSPSPLTCVLSWSLGLMMQSNALAPGGKWYILSQMCQSGDSGLSVICSSVEEVTTLYSFRRKGSALWPDISKWHQAGRWQQNRESSSMAVRCHLTFLALRLVVASGLLGNMV